MDTAHHPQTIEITGGAVDITTSTTLIHEEGDTDIIYNVHDRVTLELVLVALHEGTHNIKVNLLGEHARISINGIYFAKTGNITIVIHAIHAQQHTTSRLETNGIIIDGHVTVKGLIEIDANAFHADGYEKSNSIIIGKGTSISIPDLQIHNNEVKCSHGSTTARLSAEKIFYLMSRGLSEVQAKRLVMTAFYTPVLERITSEEVRTTITHKIHTAIEEATPV